MPPRSKRKRPLHINNKPRVFLVHGRDDGTKATVARFLEKLAVEVVILHEKPNMGRSILEKFESFSTVDFAVVLLTGDDRGGEFSLPFSKQSKRARQNVIFELGFFLGRLGPQKVCSLYEKGVELPSDYSGIVYLPLESTNWKTELAKELKSAGLKIDISQILNI